MLVNIDGKKISSMEDFHDLIEVELSPDRYYGRNLDALWDLLTDWDGEIKIKIVNAGDLSLALGDYYGKILGLFMDFAIYREDFDLDLEIK